jgi:hypothetical protein
MKSNRLCLQFLHSLSFVFICLALVSCSDNNKPASPETSKPTSFDQTTDFEVTSLCDGSAYAKSSESGLWYLRGNKAVKVTVLSDASQKIPDFDEITPILDGGAYATCLSESGLWYLHGEHAEKIKEVSSLETQTNAKISDNAFFALYVAEHKKRKAAEDIVNNPPEPPDSSDNGSDNY